MKALRDTLLVARREAAAFFYSPIAWVVLVLFLVVQGFSFWAVLQVLADPAKPAPYGAVLRTHFGGTFLYWTFLFFVVAVTTMRLVAEEKRQGTWETLLTAPVGEGAVVVGKWLGAFAFYAFLWAPTLAYVAILAAFAPEGASPDGGPILTAYLGVLITGGAFLAVGLAASTVSANQIVAAVLAFVALMGLLLIGLAPEVSPSFFAQHTTLRTIATAIDVRRHMDYFARGIVDSRHVGFHAGLTAVALCVAKVLARADFGRGRASRAHAARGLIGVALVAAIALLANVTLARHPRSADATRAHVYTLDAKTRQILADVRQPVRVLVMAGNQPLYGDVYDEVRELLRRFVAAQPLVSVENLDPALDPGRLDELAVQYALTPEELAAAGAVVFLTHGPDGGERHRAVGFFDMAEFAREEAGGVLARFSGEAAFATAVLEITDDARPEVCFTSGHGEFPLAKAPSARDLAALVRTLAQDLVRATPLPELAGGVPARCAALAIVGPHAPLGGAEALAVKEYLDGGGRVLVALDPDLDPSGRELAKTGLELVLLSWGVRLAPAVVVDPNKEAGIPIAWGVLNGYGKHPVSAGFQGRRVTVWLAPRWIQPVEADGIASTALVRCSDDGWAESDVAGLLRAAESPVAGEKDVRGSQAVAVAAWKTTSGVADGGETADAAREGRLVVLGSATSFTSAVLDKHVAVNEALAASAIAWLTGRSKLVGVGPKTPEQFRVLLTNDQKQRLLWVCVLLLPGLAAAGGGVVWSRRRRGA